MADAVFEGGGVKGIGLVGALSVFEEQGYTWKNVAGTSAGAITAALVAAGYTAAELKTELDRLLDASGREGRTGYMRFKDTSAVDRVPLAGPALSIWFEQGLYEGAFFEEWMRGLLERKNVRTFADLISPGHEDALKDDRYRYRLRVIASDLTRKRLLELPQDIAAFEEFDGDPDKLDVARAVRMSMSIPYFFEPVRLTCRPEAFPAALADGEDGSTHVVRGLPARRRRCVIVDGGILSNFPVDLFDSPPTSPPPWPTFGFKLVAPDDREPNRINGPLSLFRALFSTMMEAHDQRHMDEPAAVRTVRIRTEEVRTTDFDLTRDDSDALYERGRQGAHKFFKRWEALGGFEGYVKKYRTLGG